MTLTRHGTIVCRMRLKKTRAPRSNTVKKPITITLDEPVWAAIKLRAKQLNRSISNYLLTLAINDLPKEAK